MCECDLLFKKFNFNDITQLDKNNIPEKRGIYVIRIKKEGSSINEIINQIDIILKRLNWNLVADHIDNRIQRLKKINFNKCPIIYIGSAGSKGRGGNTLRKRLDEFKNRHTIMYPIWTLIYFGWKIEYGCYISDEPSEEEENLKQSYTEIHRSLPALVSK